MEEITVITLTVTAMRENQSIPTSLIFNLCIMTSFLNNIKALICTFSKPLGILNLIFPEEMERVMII